MSEGEQPTITRGVPGPSDGRPGMMFRSPYDASFVERLKKLPAADRQWHDLKDGWWIAARHEARVVALAVEHFGGVRISDPKGSDEIVDRTGRSVQEKLF